MDWIAFEPSNGSKQPLPPERRAVLVQLPSRHVAVGYLRYAAGDADSPYFVTPGVGGDPVAWCDCLGDDFSPPLWVNWRQKGHRQGSINAANTVWPNA